GVGLVDSREISEIDEVDRGADDRVEAQSFGCEYVLQVGEDLAGFVFDRAGDETAVFGFQGDLTGEEDEIAGDDGLRIRADRFRRGVGGKRALHRHARTRCTRMTPFTLPRPRMTRFRASTLSTITSKTFTAFLSMPVRTSAREMLT